MLFLILMIVGSSMLIYAFRSKIFKKDKKEMKKKMTIRSIIGEGLNIVIIVLLIVVPICFISLVTTSETKTIEGKIIKTIPHDDYLEVFFDNGEHYKITYPVDTIDLSNDSKIILRLNNVNIFWIDDGVWNTISITRI